jgi:two-component system, cell cycle sensor histidine kinase and response regulator CckA
MDNCRDGHHELQRRIEELERENGALRAASERAHGLLNTVTDWVWEVDAEGLYTYVGPQIVDLLGYSPEEILGKSAFDLMSPEEAARVHVEFGALVREKAPIEGMLNVNLHKDGREILMETSGGPILTEDGTLVGYRGIDRDVTARIRARDALRLSEDRFRSVIQSSPMGIHLYQLEEDGRLMLIDSNVAADRMVGVSTRELIGMTIDEAFPALVDTEIPERYRVVARDGKPWETRTLEYRDGEIHGAYDVYAFQTSPGRMAVMFLNVTDRKRAEEALCQSEERLRHFVEHAPVVLWATDQQGIFTFSDGHGLDAIGLKPGEIIGKSLFDVYADSPDIIEQTRQTLRGETVTVRNLVGGIHFETQLAPLRDSDDAIVGTIGVAMDITARIQAEEDRQRMEEQFRHAQKLESLGVLAGGIAHDFNNILVGILGYADLASHKLPPGSHVSDDLEQVKKAAVRAADLAKQMLAYSGKGKFIIQPIDLNALVRDTARLLKVSVSKKVVLQFNLAESLPATDADGTQIQQVIMNLITNASEAVGDQSGVISISTSLVACSREELDGMVAGEDAEPGNYVCLEVTDSGCGMSEDTRAKLFDPFFSTKFTGRGLGLAAVFGIVRGHGGAMWVDSALGKGTTMRAFFPSLQTAAPAKVDEQPAHPSWRGSGMILLADDESLVRRVAGQMLEMLGFSTCVAGDGHEAVELFRELGSEITCVILDLTMPRMDGVEALEEIRKMSPDVPIFLSSGYTEQDIDPRLLATDVAGFLQKPYKMKAIRAALRGVFDKG